MFVFCLLYCLFYLLNSLLICIKASEGDTILQISHYLTARSFMIIWIPNKVCFRFTFFSSPLLPPPFIPSFLFFLHSLCLSVLFLKLINIAQIPPPKENGGFTVKQILNTVSMPAVSPSYPFLFPLSLFLDFFFFFVYLCFILSLLFFHIHIFLQIFSF